MAKPEELETVDFEGVDVLAVGGPYFGQGSPPEGDFYTEEDLRAIADNTRRLLEAGELRAPIKLGHALDQKLAKESGYEEGEMPALGWVENPRVANGKLLTDWRKVPKKLGGLIRSGAFRTRSLELRSYVSQKGGEKIGPAIKGIALMGAKAPAVRTLDDVIALYSDETEEDVQIREYGEMIWNPDLGYRWVQASISSALNPSGDVRYYVADVGPDTALVVNCANSASSWETTGGAWVVPFTVYDDNTTIAPADEWTWAQPRWVEIARDYFETSEPLSEAPADTRDEMANLTEDQERALAERLGLDSEEFEFDAALGKIDELRALEDSGDEGDGEGGGEEGDMIRVPKDEWEAVKAAAEAGQAAETKLSEMERDRFLEDAVEEGKLVPADLDDWKRRYDENPEFTKEIVTSLRPHQEFLREFGSDSDGRGATDEKERDLGDAFDSYMGVTEDQRVVGGKA